jgi:KDO2-lipid IV(A) lauroyltransferase
MYNYFLYKIGQFIALRLPIRLGYKLAIFISDLRYIFAKVDRANVTANLKVIFPDKNEKEIARIRLEMFRNFAKYLVDFFRFPKIDLNYIKQNIRIENSHYFNESLSKGKGVIALSAHIGNWELGAATIALLGYPFLAVALPHKHKKVNSFFNSQREAKGIKVIPFGKAVRNCLDALKENKIVALVGDRDFSEKGMVLDFFGKPTFLPEGAAAFSLKTGASIVPAFMLRDKDDKFILKLEKPIEYTATTNRNNDIVEIIKRCKSIIEYYIRKYPDQWLMYRKFWIE